MLMKRVLFCSCETLLGVTDALLRKNEVVTQEREAILLVPSRCEKDES